MKTKSTKTSPTKPNRPAKDSLEIAVLYLCTALDSIEGHKEYFDGLRSLAAAAEPRTPRSSKHILFSLDNCARNSIEAGETVADCIRCALKEMRKGRA